MLIFTVENIQGYDIEEYLGYVSETVTLGINDIRESFQIADILGGESSTYREKFDKAKEILEHDLKTKAKNMQGNGIIGLRINYQEILAKGKSSILISGTGTVVKFKENEKILKHIEEEKKGEREKYEKLGILNWLEKNKKI